MIQFANESNNICAASLAPEGSTTAFVHSHTHFIRKHRTNKILYSPAHPPFLKLRWPNPISRKIPLMQAQQFALSQRPKRLIINITNVFHRPLRDIASACWRIIVRRTTAAATVLS